MRSDLALKSAENRKKIEQVLATAERGMTLSEIAKAAELPVSTVKRHLEKLVTIGTVHVESYRGFNVYIWNGDKQYRDKIFLSKNHVLFIDTMINPWGKPFIRIKESKRNPITGEWEDIGAILVDSKRIKDLIQKLVKIEESIEKYREE